MKRFKGGGESYKSLGTCALASLKTRSEAHPTSYPMDTGGPFHGG
jgi:hypothetical protein